MNFKDFFTRSFHLFFSRGPIALFKGLENIFKAFWAIFYNLFQDIIAFFKSIYNFFKIGFWMGSQFHLIVGDIF